MWKLDVDNIPHPHIFLESSESDPATGVSSPIAVEDVEPFERHSRFYFNDDNVVFQVEDTRFKVHRYFFQRDSKIFASVFALPDGPGQGSSDSNPIRLVGIKVKDLDIFLSILYPPKFGVYAATNVDEWSSVLDLAAKWKFQSIEALAIEKLADLASPVDKIVMGRRHNVAEWLPDAYKTVCERSSALTLEEATKLGMEDVVKIAFLRQEIRTSPFGSVKTSVDVILKTFVLEESPEEVSFADSNGPRVPYLERYPSQSPKSDKAALSRNSWGETPGEHCSSPRSIFSFHAPSTCAEEPVQEDMVSDKGEEADAKELDDDWGSPSKKSVVSKKRGGMRGRVRK